MKGGINIYGELLIARRGGLEVQDCPHSSKKCGDLCPLFGEPDPKVKNYRGRTHLQICDNRVLEFVAFTDKRTMK